MKLLLSGLAALTLLALPAQGQVIITGIIDGPLSGGNPKAIELFVNGSIDLTGYTVERSSNGNAFADISLTLSGTFENTFVYLIGTSNGGEAGFDSVFGTSGIYANRFLSGNVNGNGNDAFRIVDTELNVVDQVAPISNDNIYLDSFMYRNSGTGPDAGWVAGNWNIPGNDTLDGLDATQVRDAVPFGTYAVPEPGTVALCGLGLAAMIYGIRRRRSA